MASEWRSCTLGDVIELKRGYDLPKLQRKNGQVPIISSSGVTDYHCLPMAKAPGVITGRYGTIGEVFYASEDYWPLNTTLYVKDFKGNDPKYIYYFLKTIPYTQYSDKAAVPGINRNHLHMANVFIPFKISEQKFIAHVLGSLDNKITLNRQLNQTLEQMAQALFKSWFVDFDPVIDNALAAGNPLPDELQDRAERRQLQLAKADHQPLPENIRQLFPSEFELTESLGWVPKGWGVKNLTNLVDTVSKTYPLKSVKKVIFLNTGDIEAGLFLHNNYSDVDTLPGQAKKSIQQGDILYSEIRPKNKRFAYVNFDCSNHVVSTKLMVLRAKSGIDSKFIYFVLTRESCLDELQRIAELRSGTFPQITFDELSLIELPIPDNTKILSTFSELMLDRYYEKQFQLQLQSKELSQLRDTLLPKLISGELRIPEAR